MEYIKRLSEEEYSALETAAKAALPPRQVPATRCLECHTPDNDDNFVYEVKLPKVDHHEVTTSAKQE